MSPGARLKEGQLTPRRFVREIRREPALDGLDRLAFALRVARDLILADASNCEIAGLEAREIEAAQARGRHHRRVFGEIDARVTRVQEFEQLEFLAVIRTRRIAERRPDAAVLLRDDFRLRRRGLVDAPVVAGAPMQIGGARLPPTIGGRPHGGRAVIVRLLPESARQLAGAAPPPGRGRAPEIAWPRPDDGPR